MNLQQQKLQMFYRLREKIETPYSDLQQQKLQMFYRLAKEEYGMPESTIVEITNVLQTLQPR